MAAGDNQSLFSHYAVTERETLGSIARLDEAEMHAKASGVYKFKGMNLAGLRNEDRCPCCFFPCKEEVITRFGIRDLDDLSELGLAFPFLFYLTRYLSLFLSLLLVVSALPSLIQNLVSGRQAEFGPYSAISQASVGGNGKDHTDLTAWPVALHLASLVLICVGFTVMTVAMRAKAKKLMDGTVVPSDYTVVVKNLGTDWTEEELKAHFEDTEKMSRNSEKLQVNRIDVSNEIYEFVQVTKAIQSLAIRRNISSGSRPVEERFLRCCLGCFFHRSTPHTEPISPSDFEEAMEVYRTRLIGMDIDGDKRKTGVAFIAFETEAMAKRVLGRFKSSFVNRYLFGHCFYGTFRLFKNRVMNVKKAPDPTDIIWENLQFSRSNRLFRQFLTLFVLAVILVISYFLLYGLAKWQKELSDERNRAGDSRGIDYTSIPAAAIILIINILLDLAIRGLSYFEHHHTYTEQTLSTARKLTVVLSLNTLLFPLLAHLGSEDWYKPGGLANGVFWVAISGAFAKTVIKLVHPLWVWKWVRKWQVTRAMKGRHLFVSQAKANFYFQKEEIDIADCYSDLLVRFLFTLAYVPLMPLVVPIMLIGYLADYWVNKYVLLRNSCRPKFLNEKIAFKMMFFVKPAIVLYGISIYIFFSDINSDTAPLGIAAIVIAGVFWPLHSLVFSVFCRNRKLKAENGGTITNVKHRFFPVCDI